MLRTDHHRGWLRPCFRAAFGLMMLSFVLAAAGCQQIDDLKQRTEDTTIKITRTTVPPEMQTDADSTLPSISTDGRYVAFKSGATNLVIAPTNGATAIFVKDMETGETLRVSSSSNDEQAEADSDHPAISGSGQFVVFDSLATNLVSGDANETCLNAGGTNVNCRDVFVKDLDTGITELVSSDANGVPGDGESSDPAIGTEGRYIAFESAATNLVPGDDNNKKDIFIKDTLNRTIERVSVDESGGQADDESVDPSVSFDGRLVAFTSSATNLVPDDTNGKPDVFVKDRNTGSIRRVSQGSQGQQADDASGSMGLKLAPGGGYIAFESSATNLVPDDTNGKRDIFVKNLENGVLVRVSVDAAGVEGSEDSYGSMSLSNNGRWIVFRSDSPNLVPGDANGKADIFLRDMQVSATVRLSADTAGAPGNGASERVAMSSDGRWIAFESASTNLITGDTNSRLDIFVKEIETGEVRRASVSTSDV